MKVLKKILLHTAVLLVCLACNREEEPAPYRIGDTVRISLNLSTDEMPASGTKSEYALDPKIENPIADVWVLQYDELGQLCRSDHSSKTPSLTWQGHLVELDVRPTSTIVVFANIGEIADENYAWPATIGLMRMYHMATEFEYSLDITGGADPQRLYMVGETTLKASDIGSPSTEINVMLSRLCCKLAVGVHQSGDEFSNLRIQIMHAAKGFTVFPTKENFSASYTDYAVDSTPTITSTRKYFFYYLYENMDTDNQTKIKVTVTGKDGQDRTRIFPITSHGELLRNTYYNVDLELTGSGTYTP